MININATNSDLLVIVDMQRDFVDGPLGTDEAKAIVPGIVNLIKNFDGHKIYTKDTHQTDYLNTQEGLNLPIPHCIEGYNGWEIVDEIRELIGKDDIVIKKPTFGSLELLELIKDELYENIYFVGVCTGICVISNAILAKTADPETKIHVIADLCACISPESHEHALDAMQRLQIDIIE